ncbi:hypothetical protein HMPREF6745_0170 [Prevotella sp. oral taxon 472 str. F0295]|nr:SusF/SusE family outer membrane protein [Prevotella sp. oral taxon 472]EEX54348.1 hypothetical protein HMPREF6745_0170 [Prevotella sp. oral taxon 472 str. F0295]
MKTIIKTVLLLLGSISFMAACSDDRDGNPTILHPTTFTLETPSYASSTITLSTTDSLAFSWQQPDFGYPAKVNYQIQLSFTNKFATSLKEAATNGGTADYNELATVYFAKNAQLEAKDFAQALQDLGGWTKDKVPAKQKVYVRIKAGYPNVDTLYSNSVELNVVPYFIEPAPQPALPDSTLYFTGSKYSWGTPWNKLVPVHGTIGYKGTGTPTFWTMVYLDAAEEIKFAPLPKWGNDFGYKGVTFTDHAGANPTDKDGNIKIDKAGWYLVVVTNDGEKRTVSFEKPEVYLQGATNGGDWNCKAENRFTIPTTADGEFVSPAFIAADEVRMCVKLDGFEWWRTEFIVDKDGNIVYRGSGDDQARVKVKVGQHCHLNFSTGKGSYK